MTLLLALTLLGCSTVDASTATPELASMDGDAPWEWLEHDAGNAAHKLDQIAAHVAAMPAEERARLQGHVRHVLDDCPFNRAALQLFVTLDLALPDTPDLADARAVIDAHQRVMIQLGVTDLPPLTVDSFLAQHGDAAHTRNRAQLAASADPVAETQATIDAIESLVDVMPEATYAALEASREELKVPLLEQWPFQTALLGIQQEVNAYACADPADPDQAMGLVVLLKTFNKNGC
ncbi:MAG: hypothetical protein GY913_16505 [Proteobacteria bacterium]|nr:hypothetical protein [Pseudomonadota bacterium]